MGDCVVSFGNCFGEIGRRSIGKIKLAPVLFASPVNNLCIIVLQEKVVKQNFLAKKKKKTKKPPINHILQTTARLFPPFLNLFPNVIPSCTYSVHKYVLIIYYVVPDIVFNSVT